MQVRDEAGSIPAGYEAPVFKSSALQHTKPKLSWDKDDESRKKVLGRSLTAAEIKEDDFKAFLASDSGSDEDYGAEGLEAIRERCATPDLHSMNHTPLSGCVTLVVLDV